VGKRAVCAALAIASLSGSAIAQQSDAFDDCERVQDVTARVACFDRAVAARHATHPAPAAAAPAAAPSAAAAATGVAAGAAVTAPRAAAQVAAPAPVHPADSNMGLNSRQIREQQAERGAPPPPPPAKEVEVATIVKVIQRGPLLMAFELSNGQIWEQAESMRFAAEPQQSVTIRSGMMGSFFLKNAAGVSVRVHRLK
jgi:hypothetical protein